MVLNRREFLKNTALAIFGGKVLYNTIKGALDDVRENRIYHGLSNYIQDVETSGNLKGIGYKEMKGKGIVTKDRLITCAHITDIGTIKQRTPFGIMKYEADVQNKEVSINGNALEEVVFDKAGDIAVYTNRSPLPRRPLPEDRSFFMEEENFPCEPSSKRELGDDIYLIGNPILQGLNIRKGKISDLDGFGKLEISQKCFGIDINTIAGDSGSPVVSKDFKLLGIVSLNVVGLGYVLKIEEFFK